MSKNNSDLEDEKREDPEQEKHRIRVYVGNIPYETKEREIKEEFEKAGIVLSVSIPKYTNGRPKGYAFVEVPDEETCDKMIERFHETTFNGQRKIYVEKQDMEKVKNRSHDHQRYRDHSPLRDRYHYDDRDRRYYREFDNRYDDYEQNMYRDSRDPYREDYHDRYHDSRYESRYHPSRNDRYRQQRYPRY